MGRDKHTYYKMTKKIFFLGGGGWEQRVMKRRKMKKKFDFVTDCHVFSSIERESKINQKIAIS